MVETSGEVRRTENFTMTFTYRGLDPTSQASPLVIILYDNIVFIVFWYYK